jgi:hypothetical protein
MNNNEWISVRKQVTDEFNNMPFEHRSAGVNTELLARISDLEMYKKRLKDNYDRELAYLDERIHTYRHLIRKRLSDPKTT